MLAAAYIATTLGPPPPSVRAIGISAIAMLLTLAAVGAWIDRGRSTRPSPIAALTMDQRFFRLGALSAFIAVAAGAFGAHALRARLDLGMLTAFETGARYQMYHALALMAVAWASEPLAGQAHCGGRVVASWRGRCSSRGASTRWP